MQMERQMPLLKKILLLFCILVAPTATWAQGTVLQSGGVLPQHGVAWQANGAVMDAGPASGGPAGFTQDELGLTVPMPTNGAAQPWANTGTGPNHENNCDWDGPLGGPRHYLCLSPNALGGGLLSYGATGGAAALPFQMIINGVPFTPGQVNGLPSVAGNTALRALPHTYAPLVERQDFEPGFGAPPMPFAASASPCSLNGGAGDGGSQVATNDSGCWIARQPAVITLAEWGLDPTGATDVSTIINGLTTSLSSTVAIVTQPAGSTYLFTNPVTNLPPLKFIMPYNSVWNFPQPNSCGSPNYVGICVSTHGSIGSAHTLVTSSSSCLSPTTASIPAGTNVIYFCNGTGLVAGASLRVFSSDAWAANFTIGYLIHVATVTPPVGNGPYTVKLAENYPFNLTDAETPQVQVVSLADGFGLHGLTIRGPAIGNGTVGPITNLGTITAGSGYTNGTYTNQPLSGGHGTGATATVVVAGGVVTGATISDPGSITYQVGDVLTSISIPGGSGFSVPVDMVGGDQIGLQVSKLSNFTIDSVTITGFDLEAMDINQSWGGQVRNSQGNFALGFGLGYGATVSDGSRDITFYGFTSNRTWDVVATGGTADINRNVKISMSGGNGNIKTCFNAHESLLDYSVSDSWCIAAPDARPGNYSGVTLNGTGNIAINNVSITMPINTTSTGTDGGILCQPTVTYSIVTNCTITNSTVDASQNTKSVNFLGQNLTSNSGLSITLTGNHSLGGQTAYELSTVAGSGPILSAPLTGNDTPIAPVLRDLFVAQASTGGVINGVSTANNTFKLATANEMIYFSADDTGGITNLSTGPDNLIGSGGLPNYVRLLNVAGASVRDGLWVGGSTAAPLIVATSTGVLENIATPAAFSTLDACNAGNNGSRRVVNDATTPTYGGVITGGSNVPVNGICRNGTGWTSH